MSLYQEYKEILSTVRLLDDLDDNRTPESGKTAIVRTLIPIIGERCTALVCMAYLKIHKYPVVDR